MNNHFPQYTTDYISGVMSLRKPQTQSLKILEEIVNTVQLRKGMNLKAALGAVHAMYPICSDFERDFMSLTFALATGVGKTRLMGAFIAYLYTQHNIRNFFVVAPNTTIYEKLKKDLSDSNSEKYVFRGLGCFVTAPQIITDDDYREKTISLSSSSSVSSADSSSSFSGFFPCSARSLLISSCSSFSYHWACSVAISS